MKTTFREIKNFKPCLWGWSQLCNNILKTNFPKYPEGWQYCKLSKEQLDTEVSILEILESNGVKDAFWALRTQDYKDYCLILADIVESVFHSFEEKQQDNGFNIAIKSIRKRHSGEVTKQDLKKAAFASATAYATSTVYSDYAAAYAAIYTAASAADIYNTDELNQQWSNNEEILRKCLKKLNNNNNNER